MNDLQFERATQPEDAWDRWWGPTNALTGRVEVIPVGSGDWLLRVLHADEPSIPEPQCPW